MVDIGQDVSDHKDIDPTFGTFEEFTNMKVAMHKKGMITTGITLYERKNTMRPVLVIYLETLFLHHTNPIQAVQVFMLF